MNNKEFIVELATKMRYSQTDTQRMVTAIIDAMADTFQEGKNVDVTNFGVFEIKKKLERVMVHPSTQKRMLVPPKLVLGFKPNNGLKNKLKAAND